MSNPATQAGVMPTSPFIESMPAEIKVAILRSLPDYKALRALVHASPDYYQSYLLARDDILTDVTLADLKARKIDVVTPIQFAEVCINGGKVSSMYLLSALETVHRKMATDTMLKLSIDQCRALLSAVDLKGYRATSPFPSNVAPIWSVQSPKFYDCITHDNETQYLEPYGWRKYDVLELGAPSKLARDLFNQQLKRAHIAYGRARVARRKDMVAKALKRQRKERIEEETKKVGEKLVKTLMEKGVKHDAKVIEELVNECLMGLADRIID
ncbi:MAG: hypothetical protein Q9201_000954 [Fulgogasparrea decipioides]